MKTYPQEAGRKNLLYLVAAVLALITLGVTVLLIMAHYETASAGAFCNINDYWNCDRVNKSVFAEIYGVPVSILGFLYYAFLTGVLTAVGWGKDVIGWLSRKQLSALLLTGTVLAFLGLLIMTAIEITLLKGLFWIAIIKLFILAGGYYLLYRRARGLESTQVVVGSLIAILALFGVSFSLYLTDIELFVLRAICVYCFSQQILIIIIFLLSLLAIIKQKHERSTTAHHPQR